MAGGPHTPDRRPGVADEEGTIYETTLVATQQGEVRYTGTRFSLFDGTGEYDPRSGGGLSEAQHEALDTLAHGIVENSHEEIIRDSKKRLVQVIDWTNSSKTKKIREVTVSRSGKRISQIVMIQFDASGVESYRITETINRTGKQIDSVDRVRV